MIQLNMRCKLSTKRGSLQDKRLMLSELGRRVIKVQKKLGIAKKQLDSLMQVNYLGLVNRKR